MRCYVCNAKRAAAFQPAAPAETGGLPSVGVDPDEAEPAAEPAAGPDVEPAAEPAMESKLAAAPLGPDQGGEVAGNTAVARRLGDPREAGGLPSVGGSTPDEAEPEAGPEAEPAVGPAAATGHGGLGGCGLCDVPAGALSNFTKAKRKKKKKKSGSKRK